MTAVGHRIPPWSVPMFFVVGAVSQYVGAAIGVFLFETTDPAAVAWLRAASAAIALMVWRRPWRLRWTRQSATAAAGFGVVTVGMNVAFFEAIARIPLGTAVAIEFLGPVAVATLGSRRPRDLLAVVAAAAGVALLAGVQAGVDPAGVGFALSPPHCGRATSSWASGSPTQAEVSTRWPSGWRRPPCAGPRASGRAGPRGRVGVRRSADLAARHRRRRAVHCGAVRARSGGADRGRPRAVRPPARPAACHGGCRRRGDARAAAKRRRDARASLGGGAPWRSVRAAIQLDEASES